MTFGQDSLREVLARHRAFWQCGSANQPLVGKVRMPRNPLDDFDWGLPEGQGKLEPQLVVVDHFLPQVEEYYQAGGVLDGDLFWPVVPTRSIPWLEAIMGASIFYSNDHGVVSIFAEPVISDWDHAPAVVPLPKNPWFLKLVEFVKGLARVSGGRFPLAGSHVRGPWDMVSALRGMSKVLGEFYSNPDRLTCLAEQCTDLWIQVVKRLAEIVPPWEEGYVGVFGLWAPGFSPMPQDDMSVSVSPRMYKEILALADLRTVETFEYPMFHTHSGGVHHLDAILGLLTHGGSLNVVIDDTGLELGSLIPLLRKVQERRVPLHLYSPRWTQVEELRLVLSPSGLAISYAD
jgi:hypothetical protein